MPPLGEAGFKHSGGAILSDRGPIPLAQARGLAIIYAKAAALLLDAGDRRQGLACARRAIALARAAREAADWRRAAGWRIAEAADQAV